MTNTGGLLWRSPCGKHEINVVSRQFFNSGAPALQDGSTTYAYKDKAVSAFLRGRSEVGEEKDQAFLTLGATHNGEAEGQKFELGLMGQVGGTKEKHTSDVHLGGSWSPNNSMTVYKKFHFSQGTEANAYALHLVMHNKWFDKSPLETKLSVHANLKDWKNVKWGLKATHNA